MASPSDIAIATVALVHVGLAGLAGWRGYRAWRYKRISEENDRRCVENDICSECGDCYLDHIRNHGRYTHTFTNIRS